LIDTYDTEKGAVKVVDVARKLSKEGSGIKGVRLDSGDLAKHARCVRRILDDGGLEKASIFASGNLDEYSVEAMLASRAPIEGFGTPELNALRQRTLENYTHLQQSLRILEPAAPYPVEISTAVRALA
jgi:nicotinic acid phosphoribosyltransferase